MKSHPLAGPEFLLAHHCLRPGKMLLIVKERPLSLVSFGVKCTLEFRVIMLDEKARKVFCLADVGFWGRIPDAASATRLTVCHRCRYVIHTENALYS